MGYNSDTDYGYGRCINFYSDDDSKSDDDLVYSDYYGQAEGTSLKATKEMCNDFTDLFEKQLFTDVTFKLADGELKAHKGILSCNYSNSNYVSRPICLSHFVVKTISITRISQSLRNGRKISLLILFQTV